jgi:hypothetical protein
MPYISHCFIYLYIEIYLLVGVLDYSLWFGKPDDYETTVMVEAKKPDSLNGGMLQYLAYMGK